MDDLSGKLSALLNDPDGMARIQQMAQTLLNDTKEEKESTGLDIARIAPLISKINARKPDNRTSLLMALRPHLSEKRRERLDTAVKLLRVADMLPLLQDSGLFNL